MKETPPTVTFVIGAPASGKSTFIKNHFFDRNDIILEISDYQKRAFKEAGIGGQFNTPQTQKCLYNANLMLITDIIELLQTSQNVIVESTLFKTKRRVQIIDELRKVIDALEIEFFVMLPNSTRWETYLTKRNLQANLQYYKSMMNEFELPNPIEGIDRIFHVVNDDIQLRMDSPSLEILSLARQELENEANRMCTENE